MSLKENERARSKANKIDELMKCFYENGQFNGTILVAEKGKVLYKKAFGYANLEWKIPNNLDTKFRIASVTKQFTAMLILQLVTEGKLRLDGKVADYLPNYPKETGQKITIHHLLTHTSGIIGEPQVPNLEDIERMYYTKDEMLKYISEQKLLFEPGEGSQYSNFGYYLIGLIIERVSGKSYEQFLKEKICEPAGMKNTIPDVNAEIIEKRASGYHYNYFTGPENAPLLDMSFVFSYGHLLSTVEDLYLWDKALYTDKLLTKNDKEIFYKYYYGRVPARRWFSQSVPIGKTGDEITLNLLTGSINGFKSNILRIERDKIFIAQLSNYKEPHNNIVVAYVDADIDSRILAILYDREYELPKKSAAYAVFQVLVKSGAQVAVEKYRDLYKNQHDRYYFNEDEFNTLAYKLYEVNKLKESIDLYKLIPENENAQKMIKIIEEKMK